MQHEGITIDLSTEQYDLVHRIAQLQDIEPSELIMGYIKIGLDADTEAPVHALLPIAGDDLDGIIKSLVDE